MLKPSCQGREIIDTRPCHLQSAKMSIMLLRQLQVSRILVMLTLHCTLVLRVADKKAFSANYLHILNFNFVFIRQVFLKGESTRHCHDVLVEKEDFYRMHCLRAQHFKLWGSGLKMPTNPTNMALLRKDVYSRDKDKPIHNLEKVNKQTLI